MTEPAQIQIDPQLLQNVRANKMSALQEENILLQAALATAHQFLAEGQAREVLLAQRVAALEAAAEEPEPTEEPAAEAQPESEEEPQP